MPRATYDDLLRVAHRWAMTANQQPGQNVGQLVVGWSEVVAATRGHLRWLRGNLRAPDLALRVDTDPDYYLHGVAQGLGAATDLLAGRSLAESHLFDDLEALSAARSRAASITTSAAAAVERGLLSAPRDEARRVKVLSRHLRRVVSELERQRAHGGSAWTTNPLSRLATAAPPPGFEPTSFVAELAASWQRAHEEIPARVLLTRDLRSITAQVRSAGGYAAHFANALVQACPDVGIEPWMVADLRKIGEEAERAEAAGKAVAMGWRSRLSDLNGRSDHPGVHHYVVLLGELRRLTMRDGRTVTAPELVTSQRSAYALIDALDELAHATHRVAQLQQEATAELIGVGGLFAPTVVVARNNPDYRHGNGNPRPTRPGSWARTTRPQDFTELTRSLDELEQHWSKTATLARRVAATPGQLRPYGGSAPLQPPLAAPSQRASRDPLVRAKPEPDRSAEMTPEVDRW